MGKDKTKVSNFCYWLLTNLNEISRLDRAYHVALLKYSRDEVQKYLSQCFQLDFLDVDMAPVVLIDRSDLLREIYTNASNKWKVKLDDWVGTNQLATIYDLLTFIIAENPYYDKNVVGSIDTLIENLKFKPSDLTELTSQDLECLKDNRHYNDNILQAHVYMLQQRFPQQLFVPAYFYEKMISNENSAQQMFYQGHKKAPHDIFIAANVATEPRHWFLIHISGDTLTIYDSIESNYRNKEYHNVESLITFLQELDKERFGRLKQVSNVKPMLQADTSSCGVYMIHHMYLLAARLPIIRLDTYEAKVLRTQILRLKLAEYMQQYQKPQQPKRRNNYLKVAKNKTPVANIVQKYLQLEQKLKYLGHGSGGIVYHIENTTKCVKVVPLENNRRKKDKFVQEVKTAKTMGEKQIGPTVHTLQNNDYVIINNDDFGGLGMFVMDSFTNNLHDSIRKHPRRLSTDLMCTLYRLMWKMTSLSNNVYQRKFICLDLKTANFVVNYTKQTPIVRVIDFDYCIDKSPADVDKARQSMWTKWDRATQTEQSITLLLLMLINSLHDAKKCQYFDHMLSVYHRFFTSKDWRYTKNVKDIIQALLAVKPVKSYMLRCKYQPKQIHTIIRYIYGEKSLSDIPKCKDGSRPVTIPSRSDGGQN